MLHCFIQFQTKLHKENGRTTPRRRRKATPPKQKEEMNATPPVRRVANPTLLKFAVLYCNCVLVREVEEGNTKEGRGESSTQKVEEPSSTTHISTVHLVCVVHVAFFAFGHGEFGAHVLGLCIIFLCVCVETLLPSHQSRERQG